jgi:hypothetical protein
MNGLGSLFHSLIHLRMPASSSVTLQARAKQGVTRLVVSPGSAELAGMQSEISSCARRLGLG